MQKREEKKNRATRNVDMEKRFQYEVVRKKIERTIARQNYKWENIEKNGQERKLLGTIQKTACLVRDFWKGPWKDCYSKAEKVAKCLMTVKIRTILQFEENDTKQNFFKNRHQDPTIEEHS